MGIAMAFGMAITWAINGAVLRLLPDDLDPFWVNLWRAVIGLALYIPLLLLTGSLAQLHLLTRRQLLLLGASVLVAGVAGDACYLASLRRLGLSRAFPIVNSYPLFALLLGVVLGSETFRWSTLLGACLVVVGLAVVMRQREADAEAEAESGDSLNGVGLAVGTAALYGLEGVLIAAADAQVNGMLANAVRAPLVIVCGAGIVLARGNGSRLRDMGIRGWLALIASAALGWVLAGSMWVGAVGLLGAAVTSTIGASSPLFAVLMGALFLGEKPGWSVVWGTALSVAGIILVL